MKAVRKHNLSPLVLIKDDLEFTFYKKNCAVFICGYSKCHLAKELTEKTFFEVTATALI